MQLSFAHLSDPHLPLPEHVAPRQLFNKRLLGYMSWHRKRHLRHRPEVMAAMEQDIQAASPDHIVVSGDLTNIALPEEFSASQGWLKSLGSSADLTVIPGNHDAYVPVSAADGIGKWAPWMMGDDATSISFPFQRRRGPVVFVMLSSATPTQPFSATGTLGSRQLEKAETMLAELDRNDVFRVVVLHHPPEDYPTTRRKALRDRCAFREVLARTGAELVLHGHQHHSHFGMIAGPDGRIPVLGVPSASMALTATKGEAARWNLVSVCRESNGWRLSVHVRGLTPTGFETFGRWDLVTPLS